MYSTVQYVVKPRKENVIYKNSNSFFLITARGFKLLFKEGDGGDRFPGVSWTCYRRPLS